MTSQKTYFKTEENDNEIKEDFCPSCLTIPLAFAAAGMTGGSAVVSKKHKKYKKALLVSGIITFVLSLLIFLYYFFKKDCVSCKF